MIRRLCIIGVGLIGGSLARALRQANACQEIIGASRQRANLEKALALGVIDRFETDIGQAVAGADMIVVCVPMNAMGSVFSSLRGHLAENAVLTDAGSVKGSVLEAACEVFGEVPSFLVPGHPIAGTEHSGVEASFATLFQNHQIILTPCENTNQKAIERVRGMWLATGAYVDTLAPHHHDEILAATSHIPHLLAYALVGLLGQMEDCDEIFKYAAGGFRDSTRIASSDPHMWRDICLANTEAILNILDNYRAELDQLADWIRLTEGEMLFAKFKRAKEIRDHYMIDSGNTATLRENSS